MQPARRGGAGANLRSGNAWKEGRHHPPTQSADAALVPGFACDREITAITRAPSADCAQKWQNRLREKQEQLPPIAVLPLTVG
jgi:hypothetical protein